MIVYSDELVAQGKGKPLHANAHLGKLRIVTWNFAALPAGHLGDVLICGRIPTSAAVVAGMEFHDALGGMGSYGTAPVVLGGPLEPGAVDYSAARFLAPTSFVTAGEHPLAARQALGIGAAGGVLFIAPTDLFLVCVNSVAPFAAGGRLAGWIAIVAD